MSVMEDRRWLVLTFVCLALALILPMILVHGYAKLKIEKRVSAGDLVVALADLLWLAYIACQIVACMNGFGAHLADLDEEFHYINSPPTRNGNITEALRFWYLTTLFHVLSAALSRTSIGLASISRKAFPSQRRLVSINLIISNATNTLFFFLLLFQCRPIPAYWSRDRTVAHASCYTAELTGPWYAFLGVSMAADAVLTSFAVASAMGRRKGDQGGWVGRGVTGMFNLFAFGHVISTAVQIALVPALADLDDLTWTATPFALLSLIGPTAGLLGSHAARVAPLALQHRLDPSSSTGTNDNRDSLVREILEERRLERRALQRRRKRDGKGKEGGSDGGGGGGGGGEGPFRLVVLNGREGDGDEDAALAAVVEGGLARLREREGAGGEEVEMS